MDIKNELNSLIKLGDILQLLFVRDCLNEYQRGESNNELLKKFKDALAGKIFEKEYQTWYTKSLQFIKMFLPDRYEEFVALYLPDLKRKKIDVSNYTIYDAIRGIYSGNVNGKSGFNKLQSQIAILSSLNELYDSKLYDIKSLIEFDIFEKEIDAARALAKAKYFRSAGALCGVILEDHLTKMLEKSNVIVPKDKSLGDYIQLLYSNSIIDSIQFKFLTYLSGIRNKCDHKKTEDPTKEEIDSLIEGTNKVISIY